MIRPFILSDRFAMIEMARSFGKATPFDLPFDTAWAERTAKNFISDADKVALGLFSDDIACGMLLAQAQWSPLGPFKVAHELCWWVNPEQRCGLAGLGLLDAYEVWAVEQDCMMIGLNELNEPRLRRVYERLGFSMVEKHYMKALT